MENFRIISTEEFGAYWELGVALTRDGTDYTYRVTLDKEYLESLAGQTSPEGFLRYVFTFLLEREGPTAILDVFNVREIGQYFPDFPELTKQHYV